MNKYCNQEFIGQIIDMILTFNGNVGDLMKMLA